MKISIEQILDWVPCRPYNTREKIIKRTDEHWPKTLLEIADLGIPIVDKFWVLLRPEIIDKKTLHLLACDFAEHVLSIYETKYPNDDRPRKAIETKRLWVRGEVTNAELRKVYGNIRDITDAAYGATSPATTANATNAAYYAIKAVFYTVYVHSIYTANDVAHGAAKAAAFAASDYNTESDYITEREWQLERIKEVLKEVV